MFNELIRSMVRGFGWHLGRKGAAQMPFWPTIVVIGLVWLLFGVFG